MLLARVLALWAAFGSHCHRKPSLAGEPLWSENGGASACGCAPDGPSLFRFSVSLKGWTPVTIQIQHPF